MLSDEYPFAWVSAIFQVFLHHFVLVKLATASPKGQQEVSQIKRCIHRELGINNKGSDNTHIINVIVMNYIIGKMKNSLFHCY